MDVVNSLTSFVNNFPLDIQACLHGVHSFCTPYNLFVRWVPRSCNKLAHIQASFVRNRDQLSLFRYVIFCLYFCNFLVWLYACILHRFTLPNIFVIVIVYLQQDTIGVVKRSFESEFPADAFVPIMVIDFMMYWINSLCSYMITKGYISKKKKEKKRYISKLANGPHDVPGTFKIYQ